MKSHKTARTHKTQETDGTCIFDQYHFPFTDWINNTILFDCDDFYNFFCLPYIANVLRDFCQDNESDEEYEKYEIIHSHSILTGYFDMKPQTATILLQKYKELLAANTTFNLARLAPKEYDWKGCEYVEMKNILKELNCLEMKTLLKNIDHNNVQELHATCPSCGYTFDSCSSSTQENGVPKPGDVSICINCLCILQFDSEMNQNHLPKEAYEALPKEHKLEILNTIHFLKALKDHKNEREK